MIVEKVLGRHTEQLMTDDIKFQAALNQTLHHEGGYSEDPDDAGGATNCGISLRFYTQNIDKNADKDVIKNLTDDKIADIYYQYFWVPLRCSQFDLSIGSKLFDTGVNLGLTQATKIIQRAVRSVHGSKVLKVDGRLGDKTEHAVKNCDPLMLLPAMRSEQAGTYRAIVIKKPQNVKFLTGWLNRAYS